MIRYIMIAVAAALLVAITLIVRKYRRLLGKRETTLTKESVIGRLFIRKLRALMDEGRGGDPQDLFRKLNKTMRSMFSELFDIKYEFAYVELNEELTKKGVSEEIRNEIINYTMEMSEAEYGGQQITADRLAALFERSSHIIAKVTGYEENEGATKPGEKAHEAPGKPEEEKKALPAPEVVISEVKEKPKEPEPQKSEPPKKKEPKPSAEERREEKEVEERIQVPKSEEERVQKLRRMLIEAEKNIGEMKLDSALENYSELRTIYDSLSPEIKRSALKETSRIIAVYNSLIKEYRTVLTGKK